MFALMASVDIDLDIGLIVTALAPSILIIITYFINRNVRKAYHDSSSTKLDEINLKVNGNLEMALAKIDELNNKLIDKHINDAGSERFD